MNLRWAAAGITVVLFTLGSFVVQPLTARAEESAMVAGKKAADQEAVASTSAGVEGQQAAVSLEQAIRLAKEAFPAPDSLDRFETGFSQSDKKSFWELRWFGSGEPGGNMNIRVNTENGEIWGMNRWLPPAPGQEFRGLPKYSREQAQSLAVALAEKLQPERIKETRLQASRDSDYLPPVLVHERGPVEYHYQFARMIDGVPYLENGVNVTVNGDTGEVISFDVQWDDPQDLPATTGRITPLQAEQIFRTEAGPELNYFRPQLPGGKEVPLKLVYRLPGPQDQVLIDAVTGKLLSRENELYKFYGMGGGGADLGRASSAQKVELAPMEEIAVAESKNVLTMERALEAAKSAVNLPAEFTLNSSRLEQDSMFKNNKTWHFNWQAGDEQHRKWMDISVDAASGELVAFNLNRYNSPFDYLKTPDVKFSEEDARKIAEDYIRKMQPGRWGQVVFKSSYPELGPLTGPSEKPRPRSYSFNWVRLANGIQFPDNGFYLTVDSATGDVTGYRMTWWDVDFPSSQGVITKEAAADRYLQKAPLTLAYMRLWSHDKWIGPREPKVQLVYYLMQRNFAMLDAFTGQPLDFRGEVVATPGEKARFTDLEGQPAREAVELLARAGIIAGGDGQFRPNDSITQAELITMLVKSSNPRPAVEFRTAAGAGKAPWYRPYYDAAERIGIIQAGEQPAPDAEVTRELLARLTIHAMGYYQVARLSDIYALHFQDADEISDYLRGHVALATGLGFIEPVEGKFLPKAVVTRGEAAMSLVKMLTSGK